MDYTRQIYFSIIEYISSFLIIENENIEEKKTYIKLNNGKTPSTWIQKFEILIKTL
jgi:hypothetical protein